MVKFAAVMAAFGPALVGCGVFAAGAAAWLEARPRPRARRWLAAVLLLLALAAVANYYYCSYASYRSYINHYEFFHYYLGAKYAPEVGYEGLYNAAIIADHDTGMKYAIQSGDIRNLATGGWIAWQGVVDDRERYIGVFTPERWAAFVKDIQYFKARLRVSQWNQILTDKGYNGTPVWGMPAGWLANRVDTDNPTGMTCLASLDAALLLVALLAVWRAFGHRAALLSALFLGSHLLMSHTHMKGAFLRTDWAAALVIAMCLLKKGHYKSAGCLTAWATLSRIFPALFAFGIAAKLGLALVTRIRVRNGAADTAPPLHRGHIAYVSAFALTLALCFAASLVHYGGFGIWREYAQKIIAHNSHISTWRIGFKYVFLLAYDSPGRLQAFSEVFAARQAVWWGIQAIVLLACVWGVRRLEDHEALAFGFVPLYFLVAPTYYYYIMLLLPFLFFTSKINRPARAVGAVFLFITGAAGYALYYFLERDILFFFINSCMFLALALYMMLLALIAPRLEPTAV